MAYLCRCWSSKRVSLEFFDLSLEEKQKQCPVRPGTQKLEGYGRFFDISDDTILDWVDALVHYLSPEWAKAVEHWPKTPSTYRYDSVHIHIHSV